MKIHISTIVLSLVVGFIGGISGQYFLREAPANEQSKALPTDFSTPQRATDSPVLATRIDRLQERLLILESMISENPDPSPENATDSAIFDEEGRRPPLTDRNPASTRDSLISAGINPDTADDLLQRISQQEFRRLQLANLIERADDSDRQRYADELEALNENRVVLRTELGDDAYDMYLYTSGQSNRVKVTSVLSGSPAETIGLQSEDVILAYDGQRIMRWRDIRSATLQGDIGNYVDIEVLRDGSRLNFTVPTGTLGVQLAGVQQEPENQP